MIAHAVDCPANRHARNEHSPCRGGDCPYSLVRQLARAAERLLGMLNNEYDSETYDAIDKLTEAAAHGRRALRKARG